MTVSFGLAIKNFTNAAETPNADDLLGYARLAEAHGFESLWAWDHIILGNRVVFPVLDSLTTITALAVATERIKVGIGVLVLPLRNPVVTAKVLGSIDHLSRGRLVVGAAAGWYAREFDAVGVPYKQRGRLMDRNLDLIRQLWTEEHITRQVDEFNLRDISMVPQPYQRPHPPILIGGYVDAVFRRVVQRGDGWLTYFYQPDSFKAVWNKILGYAREAGRDPASLSATNQLAICVGKSRQAVADSMRHWMTTEWDTPSWSEATIESAIYGTADECVEQLLPHVRSGLDRIILIPYRYEPEQVELIAREVLPRLAQA